ncbi:MAG: anaerobic glycerol-3-phosphate dehydrogenase subunit B [Candidatus Thorarchaeota archaeon]|nr:anaerobic glycerol-3-phosphate dehydrogenase subunit B [Candidatus Thorarchaeota archaeon]
MDLQTDFLVIGGGMAGLVAGTIALEAGVSTILLRKGQSATAYSSGAIDVIGYLPEARQPFSSPEEGLIAISGLYPLHPYSIVGYSDDIAPNAVIDTIVNKTRVSIEWLRNHLEEVNLPLHGTFDSNMYPITILGTTKPTCLVQKTMDFGDLHEREDSVLLFVGIRGYPDFNPAAAAKTYLEDRMAIGEPPHKVVHCMLDIAPFGNSFNISSIEIAKHLDHEGSIKALGDQLKEQADQIGTTHIAFPPILGVHNTQTIKSQLETLTGATIFELLGFPPSVPGLRLQRAMDEIFTKAGGKLLVGFEANSFLKSGTKLTQITASSPRREVNISAKAFILASGMYIGGGISGDEKGVKETLFNLMTVTGDYHSASELLPSRSTHRLAISPTGQPIQSCGLSVDPQFRPVGEEGIEWAENLFAAGSILAGYNYSVEKSGLGVATTSGFHAAKNAIEFLIGG